MSIPSVSVITSNYNCAAYLPDCVVSVLSQSFDSWEHIIVDCGSTDNSLQVLETLSHPRLRIIKEGFCGVARARNLAIQQARGEYCAILDADDLALSNRLLLQTELLQNNLDIVAVGGDFKVIIFRDRLWKLILLPKNKTFHFPYHHNEMMLFLHGVITPIAHSILTFRRSVFQKIGGYREVVEKAEDFDLILRFGLYGRLAGVPEQVGIIRVGVAGSHSARHRPYGRDALYYAVSVVLFNTACAKGLKYAQQDIEKWLDSIGKKGVSAIHGRWLLNNFTKPGMRLSFASWVFFLKAFIPCLPAVIVCRNQSWWFASRNPENILKEYIVPIRGRE